ncbi:2343_t:CDS:2, partial [Funneliformis mosseae]
LINKEELDFMMRQLIGDQIVNDPFLLHIYWWKYADNVLIQLKLVENCPDIIAKVRNDFIIHGKLDQYLFREAINLILQNICDDKPWKQDVDFIFSLSDKFDNAKQCSNLNLLLVCNDLLKIKSIPPGKIKEIIYLGKSRKREFITSDIINLIFDNLNDDDDLIPIRSFIKRLLVLLPLESDIRNERIFFTLIISEAALQLSIGLNAINDMIKTINSDIMILSCEIIQSIFNEFELKELLPYFKHSIETITRSDLSSQHISTLQQITLSKELPFNKPVMNLELPVIFGLIEQKDAGIYLCAILDFLIKLHNEFLDNALTAIPVGSQLTSKSIKVIHAQDDHFINYEWNDNILKYSQKNRKMEKNTYFIFDLQKIEKKLVKKLVYNKVHFETEDDDFYLKNFSFKHELFHKSSRMLFDRYQTGIGRKIVSTDLLVSHAYDSYIYIVNEKAKVDKQINQNLSTVSPATGTRRTLQRIKKVKTVTD